MSCYPFDNNATIRCLKSSAAPRACSVKSDMITRMKQPPAIVGYTPLWRRLTLLALGPLLVAEQWGPASGQLLSGQTVEEGAEL